jgi:hypothetical protein
MAVDPGNVDTGLTEETTQNDPEADTAAKR